MNKNIVYFAVALIIGLVASIIGNNITIARSQLDLFTLNAILQKEENIILTEWSLHAREKLENVNGVSDAKNIQAELKKQFPDSVWQETKNEQSWQTKTVLYVGEKREETITISTSLTNNASPSYLIYEVKGDVINDLVQNGLEMEIEEKISVIFREKPTIFSCIKGEFNDKINETLPDYVNNLLDTFQATEMESLKEDDFISSSAYSSLLDGKVNVNSSQKPMNLQLGLRTQGMGGKTTIVVGTPIITIEY